MTSSRPYLLRAFYEWIVDNSFTPYIVINAEFPDVQVPQEFIEEGRIVLNISPFAIRDFHVDNTYVSFNARFSGVPHDIYAPIKSVTAVYAKENGRGMVFKDDDEDDDDPPPKGSSNEGSSKGSKSDKGDGKKPKLTVVK